MVRQSTRRVVQGLPKNDSFAEDLMLLLMSHLVIQKGLNILLRSCLLSILQR